MEKSLNPKINGRIAIAVILLELTVIVAWTCVVNGIGFGRDEGPPSVSIQFAPRVQERPFPAHNI